MGRVVGVLASLLALARLLVDAGQLARDVRAGRPPADAPGAPDVGGATEAGAADRARRVGPAGPQAGPAAGEERASPDGAVTGG